MLALCSAVARCLLRRVHPVVLAVAATGVVLVTVVAHRAGLAGAGLLGAALVNETVARALTLAFALPCLAAGAALGATLGPRSGFGAQLASSPVAPAALRAASLAPVLVLIVVTTGPPVLAAVVPVALASPGGLAAALALAATVCCALAAGGTVAGAARTRRPRAAVFAAAALAALGATVEAATRSLGGVTWTVPVTLALAVGASAAWLVVADDSDPRGRAGHGRQTALGRGRFDRAPAGAAASALALLLTRRFDLRIALLGAVAAGCAGGAVARVGGADASTTALLAACGAVLAAAPAGLAVGGAVADGAWFWRRAPEQASRLASALALGAAAVSWPVLGAALGLAAVVGPHHGQPEVTAAGVLVVGWACALGAGALAPWRRVGVATQAASVSAFALAAGLAAAALPRLGDALSTVSAPPGLTGSVLVALPLCLATSLLAGALR